MHSSLSSVDDEPVDRTSRREVTAGDAGSSAWRIKELGSRVLTDRDVVDGGLRQAP
jgi:hypothetical protein